MGNKLQSARLAMGMTQPQVSLQLKAVEQHIDVGMVSRYEKGVCLPTPAQMEKLEEVLGVSRYELYNFQDIDLVDIHVKQAMEPEAPAPVKGDDRSKTKYRKCYRIPREFAEQLPDDLLDICGYNSWQSWHDACLRRLLGEYAAKKKAVKNKEVSAHARRT